MFRKGYVDSLAAEEKALSGYVDYGLWEVMNCLDDCYRDLPYGIFKTFRDEFRPDLRYEDQEGEGNGRPVAGELLAQGDY